MKHNKYLILSFITIGLLFFGLTLAIFFSRDKQVIRQHAASGLLLDGQGRFIVNGLPFFMEGIYTQADLTTDADFLMWKNSGINTVISYDDTSVLDYASYLNRAQKNGMMVVVDLTKAIQNADTTRISTLVSTFMSHPAVLAWNINDENQNTTQVQAAYDLVRSLDTIHPITNVICCLFDLGVRVFDPVKYIPMSDAMGIDHYVFGRGCAGCKLQESYDWMKEISGVFVAPKTSFGVSQIHNQSSYDFTNEDYEPTLDEKRLSMYTFLVAGAKNHVFYSYFDIIRKARDGTAWPADRVSKNLNDLKLLGNELKSDQTIFLNGTDTNLTAQGDAGLKIRNISSDGHLYIIYANIALSATQQKTITIPAGYTQPQILKGNATANVSGTNLVLSVPAGQSGVIDLISSTSLPTNTPLPINTPTPKPTLAPLTGSIRVYAGTNSYTDSAGHVWSPDAQYVTGGGLNAVTNSISGTNDPVLYQNERFDTSMYTFPVANGQYTTKLKFAETYFSSVGNRIFNVMINGVTVLSNFDILSQVSRNTALDKSFTTNVTNGMLTIAFTLGTADGPKIDAIELVPVVSATPTHTPVPTISSTRVALVVKLHGIGSAGDSVNPASSGNMNPLRLQRSVTVALSDTNNVLLPSKTGSVTYQTSTGDFRGTIDLGIITTGNYIAKVTSPSFLQAQTSGITSLTSGQTKTIPTVSLVAGDTNNDGRIDILDYNLVMDCYSDFAPARNCDATKKLQTDITDDGSVNSTDLNLFLREMSVRF